MRSTPPTNSHKKLSLTGVVLTKMDGDARGGAALSIRQVTGQPIKFIGVGEKYDALEPFHPDRIVSRILGMGDILSLIERAEATVDKKKVQEIASKALSGDGFSLEDFRDQLRQVKKMGSMQNIMGMLPSIGPFAGLQKAADKVDEKADQSCRGYHQLDDDARAQSSRGYQWQSKEAHPRVDQALHSGSK
jgi:signal recognition particle subunit SRP54